MAETAEQEIGPDKSLLLVDDDEPFLRRLAKAMEKRGFDVETASSVAGGSAIATARPPAYAVVDLRLGDGNGLDVVEVIRERRPDSRDRRAKRIYITDKVEPLIPIMREVSGNLTDIATQTLNDDDQQQLTRILKVMRSNLNALRQQRNQ